MYCPECGAELDKGTMVCPKGHRVGTTAAALAVSAMSAAQRLKMSMHPILSLRMPSPNEACVVVVGLKILAALTILTGLIMWHMAAQVLARQDAPQAWALVFPLGAFSIAFALYGEGLLVQSALTSVRTHASEPEP